MAHVWWCLIPGRDISHFLNFAFQIAEFDFPNC